MDIPLLLSCLGSARDLGAALLNERDRQKAAAIQIDLSEKIIQAQAQVSQILATVVAKDAAIQSLAKRNSELEAAQSEKARYELAALGTLGEFHAYRLRAPCELSERRDEPSHFLCQPCLDIAGKKVVLHVGPYVAECPVCKTVGNINPRAAFAAVGRRTEY